MPLGLSENWTFTDEQLRNTCSIRDGFSLDHERAYRRLACGFIQDLGDRLNMNLPPDGRGKL
jgi:hypothetical protein